MIFIAWHGSWLCSILGRIEWMPIKDLCAWCNSSRLSRSKSQYFRSNFLRMFSVLCAYSRHFIFYWPSKRMLFKQITDNRWNTVGSLALRTFCIPHTRQKSSSVAIEYTHLHSGTTSPTKCQWLPVFLLLLLCLFCIHNVEHTKSVKMKQSLNQCSQASELQRN